MYMYCAHIDSLLLQVMMAESAPNPLHDILECTICQEVMTEARVLPCGHSFCHKCLQQCLQHLVHGDDYPCPTCSVCYKVTKDGADAIPKNVFINDRMEDNLQHMLNKKTVSDNNSLYNEHLDQILAQIGVSQQEVQQAKQDLGKQADKVKSDVDTLKKQTSDAYDVIIQHMKKEQQQQLSEIDAAYEQIEKKISETKHKHKMTETKLCSNMLYGKELRRKGTVYDYITNIESIKSRCATLSKLSELKCEINTEWDEWQTDEKGISLITRGYKKPRAGKTTLECNPTKRSKFKTYTTECKKLIQGILLWRKHLIVVHWLDDVIYVYDDEMRLENSVKVSGMMLEPEQTTVLCVVNGEASTQHLVVVDRFDKCLWWLTIEEQEGHVRLGEAIKHDLKYYPCAIISDTTGHYVQVSVSDGDYMFTYRKPLEDGRKTCSELVPKSLFVANDLSGGYAVKVEGKTFVWVNSAGNVTRCYTGKPFIYTSSIVYNGTDWLVSDWENKCVHVVTSEGKHGGYLITKKQGLIMPGPMCVDNEHHCVWLGCHDKDRKPQVMKVDYSTPDITTLKLSAKLPKMHIIKRNLKHVNAERLESTLDSATTT